ncbi:MAG: hypothetical protein PHG43_13895, partial [Phenylobacterium sp.]|nr:hypothetical protein [Phenylobacterium sp.]
GRPRDGDAAPGAGGGSHGLGPRPAVARPAAASRHRAAASRDARGGPADTGAHACACDATGYVTVAP